jgi:hypothetical protein
MKRPVQRYNSKSLRNSSPSLDLCRSPTCRNSEKASRCPDGFSVFELRRDIFQVCRWTDQTSANSLYPISRHTEEILGLPLNKYYSFRMCCQTFRIVNSLSSSYFSERLQVGHSLRTRVLHIPRHSLTFTANSFFDCGPAMWNRPPYHGRPLIFWYKFRK